ncbi:MAG: hypothetical protein WCO85_08115 [Actinomycetes bacterium]
MKQFSMINATSTHRAAIVSGVVAQSNPQTHTWQGSVASLNFAATANYANYTNFAKYGNRGSWRYIG